MAFRRSTQRQVFIAGLATFLVPACIYGGAQLRLWIKGEGGGGTAVIRHELLTEEQTSEYRKEATALASERLIIAEKIREAQLRADAVRPQDPPS